MDLILSWILLRMMSAHAASIQQDSNRIPSRPCIVYAPRCGCCLMAAAWRCSLGCQKMTSPAACCPRASTGVQLHGRSCPFIFTSSAQAACACPAQQLAAN